jgi:curli biogenesis system outer membrane secretion channel CsgG
MKPFLAVGLVLAVCLLVLATPASAEKPVLGVAEFTNEVGSTVHWWYGGGNVGWDLSDMLSNELAATGSFRVVERSKLEHVLNEQDLNDYGRIAEGTGAEIGKLTGAQYLVLGSLSAYEENVKGTGGGIGYKGFRVGGKKGKAYMAVDLRVVNTTTGELEFVRSVEGRASSKGLDVGVWRSGFHGDLSQYEKTPTGKAIRACLIEIVDYLDCAMVQQDGCMAEYDAKEKSRREKTKSTIILD